MDTWDDSFREPTEDERSARRIAALAVTLINARHPVTTARVHEEFYSALSFEAFRKSYRRDRARLAAAGIVVVRANLPTGETAWRIDEDTSFVHDNDLTPEDVLVLDCLLLPIASDPSFPYANDLRLALAKIDRSFANAPAASIPPDVRARNRQLARIESCMTAHHAAKVSYERADGTATTRTIIPLGLFPLRGTTYLVASKLVNASMQEPHVYNMDRMKSVQELKGHTYPTPDDFDVRDYIKLPFQIGSIVYQAKFAVPQNRLSDVREHVALRGFWDGREVVIGVADEDAAAAWALAEGVRPLAPASLVNAWSERLERWVSRCSAGAEDTATHNAEVLS